MWKMMRKTFYFSGLTMLLIFLSACTTIRIQEKDAFDSKQTITSEGLKELGINIAEYEFNSDDTTTLRAWYLTHRNARGTVLYLGGNGFFLAISKDILRSIYDQNMNVFAFDYRGYGQSSGIPSVAGLKKDTEAAYRYLTGTKGVDTQTLIIHGHSMGSIFALWLANQYKIAGVVLESPITDAEDLTSRLVPFILRPFVSFDIDQALLAVSNTEEIQKLQQPLLIITGENDSITPKAMSEQLYKKAVSAHKYLYIVKNGGHNDLPTRSEYRQKLSEFYITAFDQGISVKQMQNAN